MRDHKVEELLAPENFCMVEPGVYRSAFPRSKNIPFLQALELKSVISLVLEEYPSPLAEFYQRGGIRLICHGLDGNKGPFKAIDEIDFTATLRSVLDLANRPLLIHCNKGKHRTGSVVGCLRKYRMWSLSSILDEYMIFAHPKPRLEDQRFIEEFDTTMLYKDQGDSKVCLAVADTKKW